MLCFASWPFLLVSFQFCAIWSMYYLISFSSSILEGKYAVLLVNLTIKPLVSNINAENETGFICSFNDTQNN